VYGRLLGGHAPRLIAGGALALALGASVYLLAAADLRLPLFGALPTLAHAVAFTLWTCALLDARRSCVVLAASAWLLIEILFEGLQSRWAHEGMLRLTAALDLGDVSHRATAHLAGTFDPADLVAAALGSAVAYLAARPPAPS
jgi:hypothetical protein